jgi:hypothetical protein
MDKRVEALSFGGGEALFWRGFVKKEKKEVKEEEKEELKEKKKAGGDEHERSISISVLIGL